MASRIGLPDDRPRRGGRSWHSQHTPPFRVRILGSGHLAGRSRRQGARAGYSCRCADVIPSETDNSWPGHHAAITARRRCWCGPRKWRGGRRSRLGTVRPAATRRCASGSSIAFQPLSDWLDCQPSASCGCDCPARAFLVAVNDHPAPSGAGVRIWTDREAGDGAWKFKRWCRRQA